MISKYLIPLYLSCLNIVQAEPKATPALPYSSNRTSTALGSVTTPVCCFAVQDTVSEGWFEETSTSITHSVVNLTSITTLITVYPGTTKTAYETHVTTTNATFIFSSLVGINPITDYINDAPGPTEATVNYNGTAVMTAGVTIQSPAAFYVYNSIKIITVAPVTDSNGHVMCGTTSIASREGETTIATFSGMNKNAMAYFGGPDINGQTIVGTATVTDTVTNLYEYSSGKRTLTSSATVTFQDISYGTFYTNSAGQIGTQKSKPTGVTISLTTPFIYQPSRGSKGETGDGEQCAQGPGTENYGYVPQTVLDYLISNPQYSTQYPGLESCLPGGPSILPIRECMSVGPTSLQAGGDLTSGTVVYITPTKSQEPSSSAHTWPPTTQQPGAGFGGSTSIDTYPPTAQQPGTGLGAPISVDTYPPTTQVPGTGLGAPTVDTYPPTTQVPGTGLDVPTVDTYPPTTQVPATDLNLPPAQNTQPSASATPPADNAGNNPPANTQPSAVNSPPQNPPSQPTPSLGSGINSLINPLTISSPTTIPVSNAPAGLSGLTTLISGTAEVIVSSPTTVVFSSSSSALSSSTTAFIQVMSSSGTLNAGGSWLGFLVGLGVLVVLF